MTKAWPPVRLLPHLRHAWATTWRADAAMTPIAPAADAQRNCSAAASQPRQDNRPADPGGKTDPDRHYACSGVTHRKRAITAYRERPYSLIRGLHWRAHGWATVCSRERHQERISATVEDGVRLVGSLFLLTHQSRPARARIGSSITQRWKPSILRM